MNAEQLKILAKQKKYTVLYFWCNWCGVSRSVLTRAYLPLADTLPKVRDDTQVIIIYASGINSKMYDRSKAALQENNYVLEQCGNGTGLTDRIKLTQFIKNILSEEDADKITGEEVSYGIPVAILIDENRKVLNHHLPQDVGLIIDAINHLDK